MSAPKSSRAYGKAWGDTTVPIANTQGDIDKAIRKYDRFAAIQWTSTLESLQLRFRSNGRNYLFVMAQFEDDPHENRRTVRAVLWFLKGLFGLDVDAGDILDPQRALLPYLEIAPDITLSDSLQDPDRLEAIQHALGSVRLELEGPR